MRSYFIRKGHHRPVGYLFDWLVNIFRYTFLVKVKKGCLLKYSGYFQINAELLSDYTDDSISKVTGIGFGLPKWSWKERRFVHSNSVRIGFRRPIEEPNHLQIWSYAYANGQRIQTLMMHYLLPSEYGLYDSSIPLETGRFKYSIVVDCFKENEIDIHLFIEYDCNGSCVMQGNTTTFTIFNQKRALLYRMLPYYGGKKPAPERLWIDIWKEVFKK